MGNILYKLIFPNTGQFYVGSSGYIDRYGSLNYPGQPVIYRDYHNYSRRVRELLRDGEFCYWKVVKEYDTLEESRVAESKLLHKLKDCEWLLNGDPSSGAKEVAKRGKSFGGKQMEGVETSKRKEVGMYSPQWKEITSRPRPQRVGEKWWNNGEKNTLSKEQPGPDWTRGRMKK